MTMQPRTLAQDETFWLQGKVRQMFPQTAAALTMRHLPYRKRPRLAKTFQAPADRSGERGEEPRPLPCGCSAQRARNYAHHPGL